MEILFNFDRLDDYLNERSNNIAKELNISQELVGDRLRTLSLLKQFGLPVPQNQAVYSF